MSKLYSYQDLKPLLKTPGCRHTWPIARQYRYQKHASQQVYRFSKHIPSLLLKRLADLRHEHREMPLAYTLAQDTNVINLSSYRYLMSYIDQAILQTARHQPKAAFKTLRSLLSWLKTGCSLLCDQELFNTNCNLSDWYSVSQIRLSHSDKTLTPMSDAVLSGDMNTVAQRLGIFEIDHKYTRYGIDLSSPWPRLRVLTDDVFSTYQLTHRLWQDHYNRLTGNIKRDRAAYRHYVIDLPNLLRRTASNPLTKLLSIYWPLDNLAYYFSSVQELRRIRRGGRHDRETRVFCYYRVHESRKRLLVSYRYLPAACRKLLSSRGLDRPVEQLRQTSNPPSLASLQPVFGVLRRLGIRLADQYHLGHRVYYRYLN